MSYETLKFGNFGAPIMRAWIDAEDGRGWRDCAISDLANRSARIAVHGRPPPDEFVLHLTETGSLARRCKVILRDLGNVNVEFI